MAVGDAALLGSAEAVATYGPGIYAATRAAAYSAYVTAMTAAATPIIQNAIEIGYGYFGPPVAPQRSYETIGSFYGYGEQIYEHYDFVMHNWNEKK